jgi:glyoxylase-like metal-dependent hydrolase (beta-lactamase superfamily II)
MIALTLLLSLAQTPDTLLASARALSGAIPGDLPTAVGYLSFADDSATIGNAVDGAGAGKVLSSNPSFQVRFPRGYIMIDAGMDQKSMRQGRAFNAANYEAIQSALEHAGLIVVTHEHIDHVETLVRSSIAPQVAPHTMLTREQVETLLTKPKVAYTSMDSAHVKDYLVVSYDKVLPIAPGVVLIKAPGHTPGSQMVYVKLKSGRELVFAGDIAWNTIGIEQQRQKPDSVSKFLSENRDYLASQLAWLKNVEAEGVTVVVSHDGGQLQMLAKRGVIESGFKL